MIGSRRGDQILAVQGSRYEHGGLKLATCFGEFCLATFRAIIEGDKMAAIPVEPQDPKLQNSPIVPKSPVPPAGGEKATCWWNGKQYSSGATVCSNQKEYECGATGAWSETGESC
jgi:hypothetical protein